MDFPNELTVVIADDEELICDLIKSLVHWDELNLRLIGVANDGERLYEIIKDKRPDIVITDIIMPNIDGLDLIKKVRDDAIPCKFIIVSGYRQFEYAHNALKYDVADYLLKPVEEDDLNKALKKLTNRDMAEKKAEAGSEGMKAVFLSRIIFDLENAEKTPDDIYENYGIAFGVGLYRVMQLKLDLTDDISNDFNYKSSINNKIKSLFTDTFSGLCHQILFSESRFFICAGLNYEEERNREVKEALKRFMQLAEGVLDLFIGIRLTVGVGSAYDNVSGLAKSYREAAEAVESRVTSGTGKIIYRSGIDEPPPAFCAEEQKNIIAGFARCFDLVDIPQFKNLSDKLFDIPHNSFSPIFMQSFLRRIIQELDLQDAYKKQIAFGMKSAISADEIKFAFINPILKALQLRREDIESKNTRPVRLAQQYIEGHYKNPVRLEDVANLVNLNPVYFSQLFKKQTGENFSDYLTSYRINVAKELLINGEYNINEISGKVGYADAHYFSRLFKKAVGIKPTEYRKLYG